MTTNLTTRLTERAKAFNDAGLTHGVADLLTEAAGELGRIEQALEREGLARVIEAAWGNPTWDGKTLRPIDRRLADEIRTHVLGDNEGKTTL